MNRVKRSEIYGPEKAFLCLFSRISALLVTLFLALNASADPIETSVTTVTGPDGQTGEVLIISADTAEDVRQVTKTITEQSRGNTIYAFPNEVSQFTPHVIVSEQLLEQQLGDKKYEHMKGLVMTWGASTLSALIFSQAPMSSRVASVVLTSLMSVSRIFYDDWQGDYIKIMSNGIHSRFKGLTAGQLARFKLPTIMGQFIFFLGNSVLFYNAQSYFGHGTFGFDWKLLVAAGISTLAAGTWEEVFRDWMKGIHSPFVRSVSRNLRDTRRIIAAFAGPQLNSPVDGISKYSAITVYALVAVGGIKAFFTNPAVLKRQIHEGIASWRDRNKMCSLHLNGY